MSINKVKISPSILRWARSSLHLTEDDVVRHFSKKTFKKLDLNLALLKSIENNEQEINFNLLQELSKLYKRPLAVFFISNPPYELPLPQDRRTIDSETHKILSPEAILVFRRARYVQNIFAELSEDLNFSLNPPFKKFSLSHDPKKLSEQFRESLDFSFELQAKKIKDSRELFRIIRGKLEGINVFTLKAPFPTEDARAFSLVDKIPYIIVINNKDGGYFGYAPKTFSLLHEFAHIFLNEGGICNDFNYTHSQIEKFCNEFAGSFLVPDKYLLDILEKEHITLDDIKKDDGLERLQKIFKVSNNDLLRKYLSLNLISDSFYQQKVQEWAEKYKIKEKEKGFIPSITFGKRAFNNNSRRFIDLVFRARELGKITTDRAADYLGVNMKSLSEVETLSIKG
jgi:Zn-dependent peptidase ImmA (M78 family)